MTDKTESITLYIDSKSRTSGTNENFTVTLNRTLTKIKQVELVETEIPFSFYAINANNNNIRFVSGVTTYNAIVTPGNYTTDDFITELQSKMNAQLAGFTITYNTITYKLTFANATSFSLSLTGSTIANIIGLSADSTNGNSFTCQNTINLSGPNYLLIRSSVLTKPKIVRPFLNSTQDDILYKLQVNVAPGNLIPEKNMYTNLIKYGVRQSITTIDFSLLDPQTNVINLNGQPWSMTIRLITG